MPKYAKFLKEIVSNKNKVIGLNENSSTIVSKKLPPKLRDLGSFIIPCTIGSSFFYKALYNLGASINLMSLFLFKRLDMSEPQPTNISLQLVDKSITYLIRIVKEVLVKVDKFTFPIDFVVLDIEKI
uniref:Uncharacterized protein n=1 Tax=Cajanus cajan TaxID=3821 RepID=A0A151RE16_CAJCA|nr:hypothetical protein KK1_037792 [Cajanus cajan]